MAEEKRNLLREVRRIREMPKQKYIYFLLNNNKIPKHINSKGYVCYSIEELKNFQKTHRRGRPPKIKGE